MSKNFRKIYFFIFIIAGGFAALNIMAAVSDQFPDASRLQPMPAGVHPSNPGGINNGQANSENGSLLQQQINQYEFDMSRLDPDTSYVDSADHRLFVADTQDNRVLVYDLNADNTLVDDVPDYVLGQPDFSTYDPSAGQSGLDGPNGIAYDPAGEKLFVADTNNNRIMIFDVSQISNGENAVNVLGQPDFSGSAPGAGQSQLDNPYALVYDPVQGILFVTDEGNNRTLIFDVSQISNGENAVNVLGQPDFKSSNPGNSQSSLNNPTGLAFDSKTKKIFVQDAGNNRVVVFGDSQISNGENADEIAGQNESSAMPPLIFARLKSKPKTGPAPKSKKKSPAGNNFFWPVLILAIAVVAAAFIFHSAKKWYNK